MAGDWRRRGRLVSSTEIDLLLALNDNSRGKSGALTWWKDPFGVRGRSRSAERETALYAM